LFRHTKKINFYLNKATTRGKCRITSRGRVLPPLTTQASASHAGSSEQQRKSVISFRCLREQEQVTAAETETTQKTDYELAQRAASGDLQSFEELYQRHNRRVYSLCLRMTQNVSEAEDLAQEVFIQLFRKIGSFRGESAFTTWLHRLTVNQVLMHFRKRSVRDEKTTEEGETPDQAVVGTENPNRMRVVDRIALDNAIAQLPPGYRTVFVLHDVEGYEHEEIGRMLGCAVGTSKSQLHKARMKLRNLLRRQNAEQEVNES
jgi:RNA polymerase sigma-70 factor (ECF subfamily)